mgnify:CR=1 FL=1
MPCLVTLAVTGPRHSGRTQWPLLGQFIPQYMLLPRDSPKYISSPSATLAIVLGLDYTRAPN